jgi:hypothetical protein
MIIYLIGFDGSTIALLTEVVLDMMNKENEKI